MPVVIEFSNAGTQYGELGGSMQATNISFSHEDPHDLAILILDPGQDSVYKDDPLTISFPEVDFTNLTFVGMASYAFVNWTIDNSESHPQILIGLPQFCPPALSIFSTKMKRLCFPTSAQFARKKHSMANSATGFWSQKST